MRTLEEKFERSARAAARSNSPTRVVQMRNRLIASLKHREEQLAGREPKPNNNILKKQVRLRVFNTALAEGWAGANLRTNRHRKGEKPLSRPNRSHHHAYAR
jgi:hypothetical protein